MALTAVLTGTVSNPALRLKFGWGAKMPNGRGSLQDWVKGLPGRKWDKTENCWYITGTGKNPDEVMAAAGIDIDYSEAEGPLAKYDHLKPLWRPMVKRSKDYPSTALVRHRFAGFDRVSALLGPGAVWDKNRGLFTCRLADLLDKDGNPKRGLIIDEATVEAARAAYEPKDIPERVARAARELAASTGTDGKDLEKLSPRALKLIDAVAEHTGKLPKWFGLPLFPFQECGAYAVAAGQSALCDAPGLGKTRQALAAVAIFGLKRLVIVCPPLVLTNWSREAELALGPGLRRNTPTTTKSPAPNVTSISQARSKKGRKSTNVPQDIVVIRPGRKVPEFPDRGIVIVGDSLLASRPQLLQDLMAWEPNAALVDEAHRVRTWTSKRGTAVRNLTGSIDGLTVPMTGTPILANPVEMTNQLAISGHLDPIFGGASEYIPRYAQQNRFGAWMPRHKTLPGLEKLLTEHVWVRRNKGDVLTQLPKKWRSVRLVDVDNKMFIAAHAELYTKLAEWVDEVSPDGRPISPELIHGYARENIGLMSPLRVAAGLSKVPAAIDIVTDWLEQTTVVGKDGKRDYTRPLVVWAHHKEVLQALRDSIPEGLAGAAVIDGSTSSVKRQELADKFQAGELGVLFCSIVAAGFGITLTRSSDAIFVESDWTPSNVSQAEDRINRIGQTRTCMITSLVAPDTLDPSIRAVQRNKGKTLEAVMPGADNHVSKVTAVFNEESGAYEEFTEDDDEIAKQVRTESDIIERIIVDILNQRGLVAA